MNGLFSLIQYCPDPSRGESGNVGLVLLCPDQGYLGVRVVEDHQRIAAFFGLDAVGVDDLQFAERSLVERIERSRESLMNLEALAQFARTRVNDLRMTPLTSVAVGDPEQEFEGLFGELVGTGESFLSPPI